MTRLVALTGATGFVGQHAARAFAENGWALRLLTRRLPVDLNLGPARPELVFGTLEDEAALQRLARGADAVVHVAGLVRSATPAGFYRANADGAARMAAATRAVAPAARFLLISSLSAREPTLSDYAGSKRAGEIEVERLGPSLDWSILRPPAVYGPEDRELLPFFRMAASGWLAAPANGDGRLSLIHAADLGRAIRAVIESPATRGTTLEVDDFHPGGYGWPDVAAALGRAVGRSARLVRVPRTPVALLARTVEAAARRSGKPAMVTPGKVRELWHPDWVARTDEFKLRTNFVPQVTIHTGFSEVATALRQAGVLA